MTATDFRLESSWQPSQDDPCGEFTFHLFNLSNAAVSDFKLAYTSLTRVRDELDDGALTCGNARFIRRNANFHQFAPPDGFILEPGKVWRFTVKGLWRPPVHRTDGAKSAYLTLADETHRPVSLDDLYLTGRESPAPSPRLPVGHVRDPFMVMPWPQALALDAGQTVPVAIYLKDDAGFADQLAVQSVARLYRRLFGADHACFSLSAVDGGREIAFRRDPLLGAEAYHLTFAASIDLAYGDEAGRFYGLVVLAQLLHGARRDPKQFRFPSSGTIKDQPRYSWRGCHLDVSRQFYSVRDVERLLDILAWYRMNRFHWHLSDDEAWRLEIKAYPELATRGVLRGPDEPLLPQLGNGAEPVGGFYQQDEIRALVAHAATNHIEIVPEIDIPGHSTAMLVALPDLVDGQEAPDSYRSVQGYPNNALNPAIEKTYEVLGTIFDEMVTLFPSTFIHIGGDEVAANTWMASPLAKQLIEREGLDGTFGLQSWFMKRIQAMLKMRGRNLAGWDEVSHGGGVDPEGTLLMAWQKPEVGIALAQQGYDVVMTPGRAYYLDMVQDEAWQEPGASWAGTVPPRHTYHYEAAGDFPEALKPRLKGVQACIWSEHFLNRDYFNHLVFPRLPAIAEAAWTNPLNKDWQRFAAIVRLTPLL